MKSEIQKCLDSLQIGKPQVYEQITVFPLYTAVNGSPAYVTLTDAMSSDTFTVTEVSEGGSVPELKVINTGLPLV